METVTEKDELDRIVTLARKYLKDVQPRDYSLDVDVDCIQKEENWYYVVVNPSRNDINASDYSARLEKAEEGLARDYKDFSILFVPVRPE